MSFTTETDIRLRFQFNDTVQIPPSLITTAIEDAHTQLLRYLDPIHQGPAPVPALSLGETLLAGANVCRALASREALDQKRLTLGSQRIEDGARFQSLMSIAAAAATQAWDLLEPYLLERPSRVESAATDTVPLLGGD